MRNIHQIFPESKFIFCIRHPLDCILSCFIQNFELNEAMVNFLDLKRTAELYNKIMTIYSNFTEIPEKNIFIIKYEEIVINYKSNTSKLLSFLKLRWNEEMNLYYKKVQNREIIRTPSYKQVIQPIYKDSKYKWVKYKKNLEPIIPRVEKWIRYLLKTTFYIQKPISPVYMVTDESTALEVYKRVIDNKRLDGLDVSFVDN